MGRTRKLGSFGGRLVMLGFGSVGQGTLPVQALGVEVLVQPLNEGNYQAVLEPLLGEGDLLLNLSVDVASLALVRFCWRRNALYVDACNEPWPGRYDNPQLPPTQRSNYALREEVLAFRRDKPHAATACITQGANPGLVSSFVKVALLNMASDLHMKMEPPASREDWAELARKLEVKVIHIAERDTTRVRSWTPLEGPYHGFLVTHAEAISIPDHLTVRDRNGTVVYRPTVHYAYHPCDDAVASLHEVADKNWQLQARQTIIRDEITEGMGWPAPWVPLPGRCRTPTWAWWSRTTWTTPW